MDKDELIVEMLRHKENGGDLAIALGITRQTLSRKMNSTNAEFTQSEIAVIKERYDLSPERVIAIFFADKVSE